MTNGGINSDPYHGFSEVIFFIVTFALLAYYSPLLISIFVLIPLGIKIYTKITVGICKSYRRIDGKTVIITGANNGIGLETAKDMAKRGGRIILACRNLERGKAALDEVQTDTGSTNLVLKHLDLGSLASVRKFCKEIIAEEPRLDILINNAGMTAAKKELTKDKLEVCMQTNHFAPFLLTHLLLDLLRKTGNARIVNVSSQFHIFIWRFDPENLNSEKFEQYYPFKFYGLSKLANLYFTSELNRRLKEAGIKEITVNALHPGCVRTTILDPTTELLSMKIFNPIQQFFFKTCYEGAQTSIHVAVSEELEGISGEYFDDCKKSSTSKLAQNSENAKILWDKSVKAVGLKRQETIVSI